jgi:hypothetical protein
VIAAFRPSALAGGWACLALRAATAAALAFGAAGPAAGVTIAGSAALVSPVWPGYWPAYPWVYPSLRGGCTYYGGCVGPGWDERRFRPRPVAPSEPPAAETDIWGSTGSPWGYVRRLPPATPESQIQPRYRGASTVRPEFGGPPADTNPSAEAQAPQATESRRD